MKEPRWHRESTILKALAHRKRLELVQLLHQRELSVSELKHMTGFPQANISQHLTLLKAARIVVAVRAGKNIRFRLTHPNFWKVAQLLMITHAPRPAQAKESNRTQVQDVVCGMWVEPAATPWQTVYKGATYFFCAAGCHRRFLKTPKVYA